MGVSAQALPAFPLWVGGEQVDTPERLTIQLPYDGTPVAEVGVASGALVEEAVTAAQQGARTMAGLSNGERADLLLRLHALVRRDQEDLAQLICQETGKPIKEARGEADRAQQTLFAAAIEARQLHGEAVPMDAAPAGKGKMAMTVREPLGVIGAITPFNVPLNLAMHKVAPALAGGNAVVHKPAERTPLSALRLAQLTAEAGFPRGAYNVVLGDGAAIGRQLVAHEGIAMISFTGSVAVGREIRQNAGLKRVTLELGNNSALIVEQDADLEAAAARGAFGSFVHSGQLCISVQRIYVHERVADEYLERISVAARNLRIGHPYEDSTDVSSLISETEATRVETWINEAVQGGAKVLTGGRRRRATIEPTVLTDVPAEVRLSCQEVFGPVVAVYRYADVDDAVQRANDTPYGLQAGIFTRDLARAFTVARKLQVGGVLINDVPTFRVDHMPYGGTKQSGLGREGPRYAIEEMTDPKLICWNV